MQGPAPLRPSGKETAPQGVKRQRSQSVYGPLHRDDIAAVGWMDQNVAGWRGLSRNQMGLQWTRLYNQTIRDYENARSNREKNALAARSRALVDFRRVVIAPGDKRVAPQTQRPNQPQNDDAAIRPAAVFAARWADDRRRELAALPRSQRAESFQQLSRDTSNEFNNASDGSMDQEYLDARLTELDNVEDELEDESRATAPNPALPGWRD